jgi:hypothetical protein
MPVLRNTHQWPRQAECESISWRNSARRGFSARGLSAFEYSLRDARTPRRAHPCARSLRVWLRSPNSALNGGVGKVFVVLARPGKCSLPINRIGKEDYNACDDPRSMQLICAFADDRAVVNLRWTWRNAGTKPVHVDGERSFVEIYRLVRDIRQFRRTSLLKIISGSIISDLRGYRAA